MDRPTPTRRQFSTGLAAVGSLALAGCLNGSNDDDDSDGDSNENLSDWEPSERHPVTLRFENEDGEPISSGIEVSADPEDSTRASFTASAAGIQDGALSQELAEGEYTITATSTDDGFDDVEKDVTVDGETEVTFTLEGAQPAE